MRKIIARRVLNKYTRPFVLRYAGLWFLTGALAVLVAATSSYLLVASQNPAAAASALLAIVIETVVALAALAGLALITTHRLASPLVGLRLTCEAIRDGNLGRRFELRRNNNELQELKHAFNSMVDALEGRIKKAESSRSA
jgi:nitrogen fixation/metabolism regulation signal transduction histidine kinase